MKTLSLKQLLALAVTVQVAAGTLAFAQTFPDATGHWAQQDISWVGERQIIRPMQDGNFHPNAWMTRAEFADTVKAALNLQPADLPQVRSFEDVTRNHWAFSQIETLESRDLVEGYPNDMFRPGNPVRRVEVMQVLSEAIQNPGPSSQEATTLLNTFEDANQVPAWGRAGVAKVIQYDVFQNNPVQANRIDPLRPATRAEIAAMLSAMLQNESLALVGQPEGIAAVRGDTAPAGGATPVASPVMLQSTTTIPANTQLSATLATGLFSENTRVGDQVRVILDHALLSPNGDVVIPAGSRVFGEVVEADNSNRTWETAMMNIHFNEILTPGGLRIPIDATVASPDGRLFADTMTGSVPSPEGSYAGLRANMHAKQGSLVGTKQGKEFFFERAVNPNTSELLTDKTVRNEILLGVGDKMSLRFNSPVAINWLAPSPQQ